MIGIGIGLDIGSASGAPFSPSSLPGLVADYDFTSSAGLTLVSSTHISAVRNNVSGSMDCAQPTDSNRPIFTDPGGGAAKYAQFTTAALQCLITTEAAVVNAFKDAAPLTVLVVAKSDALLNAATFVGAGAGATRPYRLCIRNANKYALETINNATDTDKLKETGTIVDTNPHVIDWRDTGSSVQIGVDGVDRAITGGAAYPTQTPCSVTSVGIGDFLFTGGSPSSSALGGRIYRVLICSGVLSDSQIAPARVFGASILA